MAVGPSGKSVAETLDSEKPLNAVARAGLEVLDAHATVTFTLYRRVVLPADGFVFWVKADILSPSALFNSSTFNSSTFNSAPVVVTPAQQFDAPGSLHHATTNTQDEDTNFSIQRMVFTSEVPINDLDNIAPGCMYIADWDRRLRFAFSRRNFFYKEAGLYHYEGDALYSNLATQIIDSPSQLTQELIVSNSLPIWLMMAQDFPLFPLYPSYLVPDNVQMPYGAVHIGEDDTTPIQGAVWRDPYTGSSYQLVRDRVKVTIYGVKNDLMIDWRDKVDLFTIENPSLIGMMGMPVPRDAKRGQTEFSIIAQKKVIEFEVDYYQQRIREIAPRYIKKAFLGHIYQGSPLITDATAAEEFEAS